MEMCEVKVKACTRSPREMPVQRCWPAARVGRDFVILLLIFIANASQLVSCNKSAATPSGDIALKVMEQENPSQLFISSSGHEGRQRKQSEREDGFIMKTPSGDAHESQQADMANEEATTVVSNQEVATTITWGDNSSVAPTGVEDEGRIAINATRQQFLTHDQLNAATKDEQTMPDEKMSKPVVGSRLAMPRLAFGSSFLPDFLFRSRQHQQHQTVSKGGDEARTQQATLPVTTTSSVASAASTQKSSLIASHQHQSSQQQLAACPGVCLNLLVASLRCQNAIQAPCPSVFQKCCELDDVSFNGTPVETSAPLPGGDSDPPVPQAGSDAQPDSRPLQADRQAPLPPTQRPQESALVAADKSQQQQQQEPASEQSPSVPPDAGSGAKQLPTDNEQSAASDDQRGHQSRSGGAVYFLSSGNDADGDQPPVGESDREQHHEEAGKHLEQQRQQLLPPKLENASLAQSAHQKHSPTASAAAAATVQQPDLKAAASQSFDSPVTTTTAASSTANPAGKLVLIQTVNGTAYLHSSEPANGLPPRRPSRPIYANWTDYHLLMMQSRLPAQLAHSGGGGVVYHSNIDPVRSSKPSASANETKSDDLSNQNLKSKSALATPAEADAELKVLKDQHSSRQKPSNEPSTSGPVRAPTQTLTASSSEPPTTLESVTNQPDATTPNPQAQAENASGMSDQQVSGIANFLGSLFDTFITSASSTNAQNEARDPSEQSGASFNLDESALAPGPQNDRRLGLDLSFRQQNDIQANQTQEGGPQESGVANEATSDQVAASDESLPKCTGYCSLDHFLHLCDSHYASSDCARSQKCCLTSSQESGAEQSRPQPTTQSQVCHGTCLPVYHSSLCMKPNQIQLDSPSCAPGQLCCSHPSQQNPVLDGSNYIDETNSLGDNQSTPSVDQQQATSGGVSDGSFNKDHSLSVALVPPPPPTLVVAQQHAPSLLLDQQAATSGRHVQAIPSTYQQISNSLQNQIAHFTQGAGRPTSEAAASTKSNANSQQSNSAGGLMNQLFQMFKSNTGIGKQRPKQAQAQHLVAAPMIAQPMQQAPMIYELAAPSQASFQAIAPSSLMRQTSSEPPAGQIVFPAPSSNNVPRGQLVVNPPFPSLVQQQQHQQQIAQSAAYNPFASNFEQKPRPVQQITLEQMAQFYQTEPAQFAAMMQKQFNPQPARTLPQPHSRQPPAHYQPIVQHPQQQQQQQQQHQQQVHPMSPQRLHGHAAPKSPIVAASNQPPTLPSHLQAHNNNQPQTRWTQLGQQLDSSGAAANNALSRPELAVAVNRAPFQQRPASSSLAFGPADAAAAYSSGQHIGWTGTNQQPGGNKLGSNLDQRRQQQQQQQQQQHKQWVQPMTTDANIVMAVQHDASGPKPSSRPQASPTQQQQAQAAPSRSQQQTGSSGAKVSPSAPTGASSAELAPVRKGGSAMASAPSELNPVHTNALGGQPAGGSNQESNRVGGSPSTVALEEAAEDEQRESCPSSCLPTLLSFKCQPAGRIDLELACASPGTVCCVRTGPASVPQAQDEEPKSDSSNLEPSHSQASAGGQATSQTGDLAITDDQTHSMIASDQQAPDNVLDAPGVSSVDTLEQSPSNEQTSSLAPSVKSKVATACGLPGPSRRQDRKQSSNRMGRVMGGFDSEQGYWCWQAALMNGKNEYLCGGALIGTKWVLTAAHCVTQHLRSESQLFVRVGQTNLNSSSPAERLSARSLLVKTSYVHHNHNGITLDNDIALLRLEEPLDLSEPSICTVCLPERSSARQLEPGKRCTVTGYGFESESGPAALRVRQTELPIVADLDCQNKTSEVLGKPFALPASSFCAGGELGQDACHGDGGSPLSCLVDGAYELTGIVSWGYKCGNQNLPGLYAKVSNFVGWINQIVSVNS